MVVFINSRGSDSLRSTLNMSKSGEILRIGHENYCFLCIHCGLSFYEIKEILVHIDYHFDIQDRKIISTNDTIAATGKDVRDNYNQTMEESLNSKTILTEFKIEECRDTETEVDGISLDVKSAEDTENVPVLPGTHCNKTITTIKKKLTKKRLEQAEIENRDLITAPMNFDNSIDCQKNTHNMFQCYICGQFYKNVSRLKRHFASGLHSKNNCYQCESTPTIMNESDPRPHKCFFCKTWYENHLHFRRHFKDVHHKDVDTFFRKTSNCHEYTCYVCKKDFLHKHYLKNHMIVHDDNRGFICDVCGKTYRTKAVLKRHSNVHEGKTYTCEECGKIFGYYARLRIHRHSHRTELNYKCVVCSKAFKLQKYLARHMKVHQDEKKYACAFCGKRFTFSTGRRAHEISQHNAI